VVGGEGPLILIDLEIFRRLEPGTVDVGSSSTSNLDDAMVLRLFVVFRPECCWTHAVYVPGKLSKGGGGLTAEDILYKVINVVKVQIHEEIMCPSPNGMEETFCINESACTRGFSKSPRGL